MKSKADIIFLLCSFFTLGTLNGGGGGTTLWIRHWDDHINHGYCRLVLVVLRLGPEYQHQFRPSLSTVHSTEIQYTVDSDWEHGGGLSSGLGEFISVIITHKARIIFV